MKVSPRYLPEVPLKFISEGINQLFFVVGSEVIKVKFDVGGIQKGKSF